MKKRDNKIRKKRGDNLVKIMESKYGVDLGYRSDARLLASLKETGVPSMGKLLDMTRK